MNIELLRLENLPYVLAGLALCVIIHDRIIWAVNRWWSVKHPHQPRHPFSPLFTAMGTGYVCSGAAFIIPPALAAAVFALFFVFGGIMGLLHFRRWWIRQSR